MNNNNSLMNYATANWISEELRLQSESEKSSSGQNEIATY